MDRSDELATVPPGCEGVVRRNSESDPGYLRRSRSAPAKTELAWELKDKKSVDLCCRACRHRCSIRLSRLMAMARDVVPDGVLYL